MFHLFYSQTPKLVIWMPAHVFSCRDPRLRLLAGCQPPPAVWPKTTARIQSFSLPHPCSRTTEFLCVFYTTTFFLFLFCCFSSFPAFEANTDPLDPQVLRFDMVFIPRGFTPVTSSLFPVFYAYYPRLLCRFAGFPHRSSDGSLNKRILPYLSLYSASHSIRFLSFSLFSRRIPNQGNSCSLGSPGSLRRLYIWCIDGSIPHPDTKRTHSGSFGKFSARIPLIFYYFIFKSP